MPHTTVRVLLLQAALGWAAALLLAVNDLAWDCTGNTYARGVRFLENGVYLGGLIVVAWVALPFWGGVRTGQWRWLLVPILLALVTVPLGTAAAIPGTRILAPQADVYDTACTLFLWGSVYDGPVELIVRQTVVGLILAVSVSVVAALLGIGGARWDRWRARRTARG